MADTFAEIDATTSALLVMDYQFAILAMVPDADGLLSRAANAIEIAHRNLALVGYVRVAFDDADLKAIPQTNMMYSRIVGAGKVFHSDAPESQIHPKIAPGPGDIVVRKTRVGAFSTTDLDKQLRERGVATLILAGISTSGVVLSTVRDAADRDYALYVLADACADPEQDVHDFLVSRIFPRQAQVTTVAELDRLFQ
jgi:nicotinamidase-related amidase